MNWEEIRIRFPQQWLLVEATKAHSIDNQRILEQLAVVNSFTTSLAALQSYFQLHRQTPERELYVFHTSREKLLIQERQWLGIRQST